MIQRSMAIGRRLTLVLALVPFAACDEEAAEEEEMVETDEALSEHREAAMPVEEWREDVPNAEQLPIEEDFADEAEASINETNYEQALDALEAELQEG